MAGRVSDTPAPASARGDGSIRWLRRAVRRLIPSLGPSQIPTDQLIQTIGTVIVGLRPDHTIFEWNREAERVYGHLRDRRHRAQLPAAGTAP